MVIGHLSPQRAFQLTVALERLGEKLGKQHCAARARPAALTPFPCRDAQGGEVDGNAVIVHDCFLVLPKRAAEE